MSGGRSAARGPSPLRSDPSPLLLGENGRLLLRDAEQLTAYMQSADSRERRRALAALSYGAGGPPLLPSLRRLLLASPRDRQIVRETVDALLPPAGGPVGAQDPEVGSGSGATRGQPECARSPLEGLLVSADASPSAFTFNLFRLSCDSVASQQQQQ
ncbi:hypothetical protein Efla_004279 [Eimeria flavescens]